VSTVELLVARCAGLDVAKEEVVACVRVLDGRGGRAQFVPPAPIRQLRDLTRYRKRLIQAHAAEGQRIQKTFEDAGIKLDSVATDILGASGRAMLEALVAGSVIPRRWPSWPVAGCAASCPSCVKRSGAGSETITPCWCAWPCAPGAAGGRHRGPGPPRR
jgi:hypothetical protein